MITKLSISNFRSLKEVELPLSKINVLTGGNNSGKSSVIYAALTLKNFVSNPNQNLDNLFNYQSINLGVYEQVVHNKKKGSWIKIEIEKSNLGNKYNYSFNANSLSANLQLRFDRPFFLDLKIPFTLPYNLKGIQKYYLDMGKSSYDIYWNGISMVGLDRNDKKGANENLEDLEYDINGYINAPIEEINSFEFIPIKRGFSKPIFNLIPLSGFSVTEEEIATIIAKDRELVGEISYYLEKIVGKIFTVGFEGETSIFYLQTRDKNSGVTYDLVNEGSGTNQLVTILAKALMENNKFICIDEPEIHLHPTIISKLVVALIEIADKEEKQFLISTHSEQFVVALMQNVAKKNLKTEDVNVFYFKKEGKETIVEEQHINEKGQIDGGLMNFYGEEMKDLANYFQNK